MAELTEAWVAEAIARHRWRERLRAEFEARVGATEVSVQSPDQLVEVRVGADGSVRQVNLLGPLHGRSTVEVSRSVATTVAAATDAAEWARRTLYAALSGLVGGETTTGGSVSRGRNMLGSAGTTHGACGCGASGSGSQCRQIRSTPIE